MEKINILTLNSNGLRANTNQKLFEMKNLVISHRIDLLFLQETHVDNENLALQIQRKLQCFNAVWSYGSIRSCGVAILNFNSNIHFSKFDTDFDGRIVSVDITFNKIPYRVINIYTPTPDSDKSEFFKSLYPLLTGQHNTILAGDFNCVLNRNLDRIGELNNYSDNSITTLKSLVSNFHLIDSFRKLNPTLKLYTWYRDSHDPSVPVQASRLDRFYISKNIEKFIVDTQIVHFTQSDHDAVVLTMVGNSSLSYGTGYWKCNNSHLNHTILKTFITDLINRELKFHSFSLEFWDILKSKIKNEIIKFSKQISRLKFQEIKSLKREYYLLRQKYDSTDNEELSLQLQELRLNIKELQHTMYQGSIIRSKATILDNNEKPSQFFFQLENRNGNKKTINEIEYNNVTYNTSSDMLHCFETYYKDLFKAEVIDDNLADEFLSGLPQLTPDDNQFLIGPIKKEEIWKSLTMMDNNKSPGPDGLTKEFYVAFFDTLGDSLVKLYNLIFESNTLSDSQKISYITLLCKDPQNSNLMKNWRPISLLNLDYKILSKIITSRLSHVMSKIIHMDQTCGVKGRSIFDNGHLIRNICDYIEQKDLPCAFISLDQEKAFDSVNYKFLEKTLVSFGFHPDFIKWVFIFYNDINSSVIVNNFISNPFPILRGVRQGCSLSPLLYVIVYEPFAIKIRNDTEIIGISIPGAAEVCKISLFADDSTGFCCTDNSIKQYLFLAHRYERAAGAKINYSKSNGMFMGKWRTRSDHPFGISWIDRHKTVGFLFGHNLNNDDHWHNLLQKITKTLLLWKSRHLSLVSKSHIINLLACSQLWYTATVTELPKHYQTLINRALFQFLWNSKFEPLARAVCINALQDGGLNITQLECKVKALRIQHIQKLIDDEYSAKWKLFARYWIGLQLRSFNPNLGLNVYTHTLYTPPFYKKCITYFKTFHDNNPSITFGKIPTKLIYQRELQNYLQKPKVLRLYDLHFPSIWKNLHNKFLDPITRDVCFKTIHDILPVNYNMFLKRISKSKLCTFCQGIETVDHLFFECKLVYPLQQLVVKWLKRLSGNSFNTFYTFLKFGLFPKEVTFPEPEFEDTCLFLCAEYKYAIWIKRIRAYYYKEVVTSNTLLSFFLSRLKCRIRADFARLNLVHFIDKWCLPGLFCSLFNFELVIDISL